MNTQQNTQPDPEKKRMHHSDPLSSTITSSPVLSKSTAEPTKANRALFNPDNELVGIGSRLIYKVINEKNWEPLRAYLNDANSTNEATRKNGTSVLLGIAMRSALILDAVKTQSMVKFTGENLPSVEGVIYAFKTDPNNFIRIANEITGTLAKVMKACPGMTVSEPKSIERNLKAAGNEPLKVEITAMPSRETTTSVARDDKGNIISSAQVESDRK